MRLLGLDIGTTGCKAIVFDDAGTILGTGFHEYGVRCDEPAMAEQDAESVWGLARQAIASAIAASGTRDVAALSLSVQGDAVILIDRDGRAIYPAVLGMDYRSAAQARGCEERRGAFDLFERTGMRAHPMNSLPKILWLRDRRPAVFERAWKVVTYADFILHKLGADPAIDHTMASRTMAFDLHERAWSRSILESVGLDPARLGRPVPSGTVVGALRPELVAEFGLSEAPMLVAGGHDQPCAALGAGMVRPGLGVVSTGTAEVLSTAFEQPVLTRAMFDSFYPCSLHAKPGMFFTFALNHTAGILLQWYRDQFAAVEVADARALGRGAYGLIDERMPDGPAPVLVLPHFNGSGTPTCDLQSKGAVVGLTLATTRHELAKAILESLVFELALNLETMDATGIAVRELVAAGGGSKSALWLQLKADILNRPIRTLRCTEAACLGAALLAGHAAGAYASLDEAVARTVRYERLYEPRPEMAARYKARLALYRQLHPALRPLHQQL
jgi:sugar (pentulose or hexulose) kinase